MMIRGYRRALAVALIALGTNAAGATAPKKPVIGFLLSTLQEERYQKDKAYFTAEVERLGGEVVFHACDNSERTQAKKMENLLLGHVDAVVVQPVNSDAAANLVDMAKEAKVPVIAYDRIIKNADLSFYVTQASYEVGKLQAEAAVKATNGKGNYVILMGQAGHSVAQEITRGVKDVLAKHPEIKIVLEKSHQDWSASVAMASMENALTRNSDKIDAVLANNSGMANGAVQAIADRGLTGKIFVAGADADLSAVKNIVRGAQHFEVLKDIRLLAEQAAQVAMAFAQGKPPATTETVSNGKVDVPVINTPVFAVTKDSIDQIVISRGFHTRDAVYGR